ncbi:MAG TPA: hypothetical protein VHI13_08975 [Candidatus Kapabacteria bacterium]|nr:hypothetical protein [Candidatus Kapabacteria bacterium]
MRMKRRRWGAIIVMALAATALGWWLGPNASLQDQRTLLGSVVDVAAIIFAIIGVRVAVLNPTALLSGNAHDESTPQTQLALDLIPMLVLATSDLAGVLLLMVAGLFLPHDAQSCIWAQRGHAAAMIFLALLELYVLTGTLLPIARVQHKRRRDALVQRETRP